MSELPQTLAALKGTIALAGAGKMGGALLDGWLKAGLAIDRVVAIEPRPSAEIGALAKQGLRLNPPAGTLRDVTALLLAVKPQMFAEAAPPLRLLVSSGTLVVSIMAGTTIATIATACGGAVVRAMPNTPARASSSASRNT
jgi:pyrroline-5-carboxylate reductase